MKPITVGSSRIRPSLSSKTIEEAAEQVLRIVRVEIRDLLFCLRGWKIR